MSLRVEEQMILGQPGDPLQVHHLVLRGSNRAIGHHLAEMARARYAAAALPSTEPLRVRVQREWTRRGYPALFERLRGVAEAFGVDLGDDACDLAALAAVPGVGAAGGGIVFLPPRMTVGHRPVVSRSADAVPCDRGVPPLCRPYLLELHPEDGHASIAIVAWDLLGAVEGVNAEGLCIAVTVDEEARCERGFEPAIGPVAVLDELRTVRYVLDGCANALEAREKLLSVKRYWAAAPAHFLVADRHGDAFAFEPGASVSRDHLLDAAGLPLVLSNHAASRYPTDAALPREDGPGATFARLRRLRAALAETPAPYGTAEIRAIARAGFAEAVPWPGEAGMRTLWHSEYDLGERAVEVSFWAGDAAEPGGEPRAVRSEYLRLELR